MENPFFEFQYDPQEPPNELSADEEKCLSMLILDGIKAESDLTQMFFSEAEREECLARANAGKWAYFKLIDCNIERAKAFGTKAKNLNRNSLNTRDDFIQTASEAICQSAKMFDWKKKTRFSTYAYTIMRHLTLRDNANYSFPTSIPEKTLCKLPKIRQHLSEGKTLLEASEAVKIRYDVAEAMLDAVAPCISLQDPVPGDDEGLEFGDIIADPVLSVADEVSLQIDLERLNKALMMLAEDERDLLESRAGFKDENGEGRKQKDFIGLYGGSASAISRKEDIAKQHLRENFNALLSAESANRTDGGESTARSFFNALYFLCRQKSFLQIRLFRERYLLNMSLGTILLQGS